MTKVKGRGQLGDKSRGRVNTPVLCAAQRNCGISDSSLGFFSINSDLNDSRLCRLCRSCLECCKP